MLRVALIALLLANGVYLAWSQGWMATLGWAPENQSEPHRLLQQVRPNVLRVLPADALTAAAEAPPAPQPAPDALPAHALVDAGEEVIPEVMQCLQSNALEAPLSQQMQQALRRSELPANSWEVRSSSTSGRWMVYLGKFANEMALEKRRAELRLRKIGFDRAGGNLEPGLSLGRFSTEEAATRELGNMLNQGIRGARVVQERAPKTLYVIRLAQTSAAQRHTLHSLLPALPGATWQACSNNP